MAEVAKAVGVSIATVSRVFNKPDLVPEGTRLKVIEAATQAGFVRNAIAGSLAGRQSLTVALIIPTIGNPIFAQSAHAIVDVLEADGYSVFIGATDYSMPRESELIRRFLERQVDGLILTGVTHDPEAERLLEASGRPFVAIWEFDRRRGRATVSFDNQAAGRAMTERLIEMGHKRIGIVCPTTQHNDRALGRLRGYQAALTAAGISVDPELITEVNSPFALAQGRQGMAFFLNRSPRPTAVFFSGNDLLAVGGILECQNRGVRVPHDISIAGFDDLDIAEHIRPALTTVRVPTNEMGSRAAKLLLAMIAGDRPRKQRLEVEIIERSSTAPTGRGTASSSFSAAPKRKHTLDLTRSSS